MKKITKLVVLLLTLALLLGSVFAVTAFAGNEAVATSTSTEKKNQWVWGDATGKGTATIQVWSNGSYKRYGDDVSRTASMTNGAGRIDVNLDATVMSNASTMLHYGRDCNAAIFNEAQYYVYDVVMGTDNKFFEKTNGSAATSISIGGKNSSNQTIEIGYNIKNNYDKDGNFTKTATIEKFNYTFSTESDVHFTFVLEFNRTDLTKCQVHLFANGDYAGTQTASVTFTNAIILRVTAARTAATTAKENLECNMTDPQSVYVKSVELSDITKSSVDVEGDLAAVIANVTKDANDVNTVLKNSNFVYFGKNAQAAWTQYKSQFNYSYGIDDENATRENVVKIKIGDQDPIYAKYVDNSGATKIFDKDANVVITLLGDLTITGAQKQANATNGFSIETAGIKTLNLNGYTFSHLPKSYTNSTADELWPGAGNTFNINTDADVKIVINGAGVGGATGKLYKLCSRNDFFKHTKEDTVTDVVMNNLTLEMQGGSEIFGDRGRSNTAAGSMFNIDLDNVTFITKQALTGNPHDTTTPGTPSLNFDGLPANATQNLEEKRATVTIKNSDIGVVINSMTYANIEIINSSLIVRNNNHNNLQITATDSSVIDFLDGTSSDQKTFTNVVLNAENTDLDLGSYHTFKNGSVTVEDGSLTICGKQKTSTFDNNPITVTGGSLYVLGTCTISNSTVNVTDAVVNGGVESTSADTPISFTGNDSDFFFTNCSIYSGSPTITNTVKKTYKVENCEIRGGGKSAFTANVEVEFIGCSIGLYSTFSAISDATSTIDFTDCDFYKFSDDARSYAIVGTYYGTTTFHEGVRVEVVGWLQLSNVASGAGSYSVADGCYIADNDGEDKDVYPYVVKEFDFNLLNAMANLTLYTDINYNLYVPTQGVDAYISAINGTPLAELETITDAKTGVEYYVVTTPIAIHEADKNIDFELTLSSALLKNKGNANYGEFKKTLSVGDYVKRVYADAKYSSSYTLMSDLIDYADAAIKYFGGSAENAFAAFKTNDNYAPTELEAVPATTTDRSGLSGYISGSTLNLEKSNVKFLFTVAEAGEYTVSYVSADGKTVEAVKEYAAGEKIEVAMRAYDLNAVITITCGEATGTYDLAAYAADVKNVDAEAYALVLEMYNYAVSAKAYKFPENN